MYKSIRVTDFKNLNATRVLYQAIKDQNLIEVKEALEAGTEVNARDQQNMPANDPNGKNYGYSPFHKAIETENFDLVKALMPYADINSIGGKILSSPLHIAASTLSKQGQNDKVLQIMELLLKNNADVNSRDTTEKTPLHIATKNFSTEAIRILVGNGANINLSDHEGNNPLVNATHSFQSQDWFEGAKIYSFR